MKQNTATALLAASAAIAAMLLASPDADAATDVCPECLTASLGVPMNPTLGETR